MVQDTIERMEEQDVRQVTEMWVDEKIIKGGKDYRFIKTINGERIVGT